MTSAEMRMEEQFAPLRDDADRQGVVAGRDRSTDESDSVGLVIRCVVAECWLGSILAAATEKGICAILVGDDFAALQRDLSIRFPEAKVFPGDDALEALKTKVVDFIAMSAQGLDLPLDPQGTAFQQRVWQALREIPEGSTASYTEVAQRIGVPKEAYAVGEACAANMIAVAIPCHRVVRKDGGLAGYRWGSKRKRALLERERT